MNPLQTFNGTLTGLFPSLSTLDATAIKVWKPEKQFLLLPMLKKIRGLRWSAECNFCSFLEKGIYKNPWFRQQRTVFFHCHEYKYTLKSSSLISKLLHNTSFEFRCKNSWRCLGWTDYGIRKQNYCWKEILIAVRIKGILGFVAVFINLVVFLNILTSKMLRKNVCMLFLCNMAFSDFVLGVYSFCITVYLGSKSPLEVNDESPKNCWKMGFLWMFGQAVAVLTSFLLTLERYLVLIFSLRQDIRISRRFAVIMIVITWSIAVFFTGYSLYFNFYFYTFLCIPIRLDPNSGNVFVFTIVIGTTALSLYLISSIMYLHIYISAKSSAQRAGIKRESKIAKKIAILVFSNILFFIFPLILAGVLQFLDSSIGSFFDELFLYIVTNIFPALCLNVNSCLNPLLYAFRNDRFVEILRQRLVHARENIRSLLPGNPGNVEQRMTKVGFIVQSNSIDNIHINK